MVRILGLGDRDVTMDPPLIQWVSDAAVDNFSGRRASLLFLISFLRVAASAVKFRTRLSHGGAMHKEILVLYSSPRNSRSG
jgi:hypothetical protein